jgi:hypothetical protein
MYRFTEEGRRTARTPCPTTLSGAHDPDPVQAELDTFYCRACGAIASDSTWYDVDAGEGPGLERHEERSLGR